MKRMKFMTIVAAAMLLLSLAACGQTQSPAASLSADAGSVSAAQSSAVEPSNQESASTGKETASQGQTPAESQEKSPSTADKTPAAEPAAAAPQGKETQPSQGNPSGGQDTQKNTAKNEDWKVEFEKSLLENYGVTPVRYEDLGDGVYQVYVEKEGKVIPYVAVNSATGDYHG